MKKYYKNSLDMMLQGDDMLASIIKNFVDEFPESFKNKINNHNKKGTAIRDDKKWVYEDNGGSFSVSLGDTSNSCKDYMNLYLKSMTDEFIKEWPRFDSEKLVGYITLYLYGTRSQKEKPLQVNYDFHVTKLDNKLFMTISTNVNGSIKDNAEKIERYGLKEIHERVALGRYYPIDTTEILKKSNSR